jgi:hypothetical protein
MVFCAVALATGQKLNVTYEMITKINSFATKINSLGLCGPGDLYLSAFFREKLIPITDYIKLRI